MKKLINKLGLSGIIKIVVTAATVTAIGVVIAVFAFAGDIDYVGKQPDYISPSGIVVNGNFAYVSDFTGQKVYKVDMQTGSKVGTAELDGSPSALFHDGTDLLVAWGELGGSISKVNTTTMAVGTTVESGHTPEAIEKIGTSIYVANRFSDTITVHSAADLSLVKEISVTREPNAFTVAKGKLYVSHHLTDDVANLSADTSSKVSIINAGTNAVEKVIPLVNGAGGVKDIITSTDGNYVYVSHVLARYAYPTSQLDRGWINTNALAVIDATAETFMTSVLLDENERGAPNPWGLAIDGGKLYASISGSGEIVTMDESKLIADILKVKNGEAGRKTKTLGEIANLITFSTDIITARDVVASGENVGEGVRDLAIYNGQLIAANYFSGNLYNLSSKAFISLGEQPAETLVRAGEKLWYDASKCYQQWESCASCHPDVRADGFNWDNLNDGLGNPKQAKSMMYAYRATPEMITGARDTGEIATRKGMQFIQFNTMTEAELEKIDEYLRYLSPTPSPFLNTNGTLTAAAERGKAIFAAECASCHPAPLFTDQKKHLSAALDPAFSWEDREFDTPTLVEIWRTAPYFYGGQFKTLRDAVAASLKNSYSASQIDDLTAYVASIGAEGEIYGVSQLKFLATDGVEKVNVITPGAVLQSFTIRKQFAGDNAKVTITMKRANGDVVGEPLVQQFNAIDVGGYAKWSPSLTIPADLAAGDKLVVSITDAAGNPLATDYTVVY
jgi:Cytochrome c peroxidase